MNKKVAIILLNYKDYAQRFLDDCINGLRKQDYQGEMKIFIVDNGTSAESFSYLSKQVPEAELVLNKNNDGFAKGNNDAIRLALAQNFDYVALFNLDVIVEPDCVRKMVEVSEGNKEIGAVQARLMLWTPSTSSPRPELGTKAGQAEKDKINSLGNTTHFLGFGYCEGYGKSITNCHSGESEERAIDRISTNGDAIVPKSRDSSMTDKNICYPSGAGVLLRVSVLKEVGLFDEEFWMYNEDQDLGWRIWLAGFRCVLAPDAVVYHKYEFSRSITKYYWMDRNRILAMLKNYHWATLILILPAFLVMELGLILFSLKSGWFKEKKQVWKYFLSPKNWLYIIKSRRAVQALRKTKDCDIVAMFSGKIWYQEIDDVKLRLINPVFNAYWWLVKKVIWW